MNTENNISNIHRKEQQIYANRVKNIFLLINFFTHRSTKDSKFNLGFQFSSFFINLGFEITDIGSFFLNKLGLLLYIFPNQAHILKTISTKSLIVFDTPEPMT